MNLQKVIPMKYDNINATLFLFGCAIITNTITTIMILLQLFGDSGTPKSNATMPLLTPPSTEIR
jgi:hypothetical protein